MKIKLQKTNKILMKFIILNFGYVESSHPYSWIFKYNSELKDSGFQNKFEAALNLAIEFFEIYKERYPLEIIKNCCSLAKENKNKYCKDCGQNITFLYDFNFAESYKDLLFENSEKDLDGCEMSDHFGNYSLWTCMDPPYGITEENSLHIPNAEKILTGLLYNVVSENHLKENIIEEILSRTTYEDFKKSFDNEEFPSIYK